MGTTEAHAVAYVETTWMDRIRGAAVHRYYLPPKSFEAITDTGIWVSQTTVRPVAVDTLIALTPG